MKTNINCIIETPRASKVHTCKVCGKKIQKGEQYIMAIVDAKVEDKAFYKSLDYHTMCFLDECYNKEQKK